MYLTNNALHKMNNFISYFKALLPQKTVSSRQLLAVHLPVSLFRSFPRFDARQLTHLAVLELVVVRRRRPGLRVGLEVGIGDGIDFPGPGFLSGLVPDHHRLAGHVVQVLAAVPEDREELGVILKEPEVRLIQESKPSRKQQLVYYVFSLTGEEGSVLAHPKTG